MPNGRTERWIRPQPVVTIKVWPSGCVCHAVRAPASNVTLTPSARAGAFAGNSGSTRTVPLKYSAGPLPHEKLMKSIELYGRKVMPMVREMMG